MEILLLFVLFYITIYYNIVQQLQYYNEQTY